VSNAAVGSSRALRVFAVAAGLAAASSLVRPHPADAAAPNLVPNGSFERGATGWRGYRARLATIGAGSDGGRAVRVSPSGPNQAFSIYPWPRPVGHTRAGTVYRANAWQRSSSGPRRLCIRIREWSAARRVVARAKTCRTATGGWAPLGGVRYTARASGNQLGVSVYQPRGTGGDHFDLDRVRLTIETSRPRSETCGWGRFSSTAHEWPRACWRPFGDKSPFNKRIPADPKIRPRSDALVARLLARGSGPGNLDAGAPASEDYNHPVVYSRPTDPEYTIHCIRYACDDLEGKRVRIPVGARPAGGGDGHLAVVDQSSGYEYDFWQARRPSGSGGRLDVASGGVARVDGRGSGLSLDLDDDGRVGEATAARFALLAGVVRAEELAAGKIEHALFITVPCGAREPSFVPPAGKGGTPCPDNDDRIPMGARLRLNMTRAQVDALRVAPWQKTILHALRTYGAYMGDTGGPSSFGVMLESEATYTPFRARNRFVEFAQANAWARYDGYYVGKLRDGVPWSRLQVLDWSDPANR
jgi:hypothetical protein